jgi:hypothetical protein
MTPEGKVKVRVKRILDRYKPALYAHWPVQTGFGAPTLDCNGALWGQAFSIETKAAGKRPTARQIETMREMKAAGIKIFLIDGGKFPYTPLEVWLAKTYHERKPA